MPTELDRLGGRWQKELRLRIIGDPRLGALQIPRARSLVGQMERQRHLGNLGTSKLTKTYANGVRITAMFNGTQYIAEIRTKSPVVSQSKTNGDIWFPQGLLVEPASDDAPKGWGIPAIPGEHVDILDPGELPDNWKVGGALPQVLLSRVADAGYPDTQRSTPLYYDKFEKPIDRIKVPAQDDPWGAYRIRFRDLGAGFMAILKEINNRRDSDQPLCPPLFGYADLADVYRRLVARYGFDETHYPPGSDSMLKRLEKEGTTRLPAPGTAAFGSIGTGVIDPSDTVSNIVDALETAFPALTDGTFKAGTTFSMVGSGSVFIAVADDNDQWIKCGNLDWKSIHDEVPILSWRGPQGRSIPPSEVVTGFRQDDALFDGVQAFIDTLEADFQGRKMRIFDRFVYARGRILGQAPDSGYVLGAAIQKIVEDHGNTTTYRLIIITWHKADQFCQSLQSGIVINFDTTSDVRVYYSDLPTRNGLACSPVNFVNDIYDEATNPQGWQLIDRHRLWPFGVTQFSPGVDTTSAGDDGFYGDGHGRFCPKTYWQPWFFNGSGTEAVCIRASVEAASVFTGAGVPPPTRVPAQALKINVSDTPSSSISLAWENGFNFLDSDPPPFGLKSYIGWDYQGDDERRVYLISASNDGSVGNLVSDLNGVLTSIPWYQGSDFNFQKTFWYLDARTDTYVESLQTVGNVMGGLAFIATGGTVTLAVNGVRQFITNYSVPGGFFMNLTGFNPFNGGDDYCPRDQFMPNNFPNPQLIVHHATDRDGHYAGGFWFGKSPATVTGLFPTTRDGTWFTCGSARWSDTDVFDQGEWTNFAGVM